MILAGGRGSRLVPLTCHRSKPAVPFGGRYRIIDFVLSNFLNSGYRQLYVLTQYMASSLIKHLNRNWRLNGFGEFIEVVPAQMRMGNFWYRGTADAVYQNINLIRDARTENVAIFGGDHIYKFAVDQMEAEHLGNRADLTVAAIPVPQSEASSFGVIDVDERGRIIGFLEKPADPPHIPGRPGWSLASMGNYFFRTAALEEALLADTRLGDSSHDFGRDLIPWMLERGAAVYAYDFGGNQIPGEPDGVPYWRDVGTVESYFKANMDLRSRLPTLNVYNRAWPIHTAERAFPPARFVRSSETGGPVTVDDSLVCEGSIVSSAELFEVMLGYDCFVHAGSVITGSVILSGCNIGAGARLDGVMLDKNCSIDPGAEIGVDLERDRRRFPFVTKSGLVVVPKGTHVPVHGPVQLAYDIEFLLRNDPDAKDVFERFEGEYTVSELNRHSYVSAGPRYRRFSDGVADLEDA